MAQTPDYFLVDITANAGDVQLRVLAEILSTNAGVEYLQRHGVGGATDRETFKKMVPVVTYEDIKLDIRRIVNGDTSSIFTSHPVSEFFLSTGTSTGESKFVPTTKEALAKESLTHGLVMYVTSKNIPGSVTGKGMYLWCAKQAITTPGGIKAQPKMSSNLTSSNFLNRPPHPYLALTSPNETIICPDTFQSIYSQLLCALCQRLEVNRAGTVFPSTFIWAIKFLQTHFPLLCNDIRTGTLNPQVNDLWVREAVSKILRPDPELADLVEIECNKESWKGIVRKLWPNTKYVDALVTGTMSQYIPALDYYTDRLPIVSTGYGGSEGIFGINLDPLSELGDVSYTLIPSAAYFEFMPVQMNEEEVNLKRQDLVDLVDVELGKEYEIVVTTYAGLYRYRVGDVLRVSGFMNKAPRFNFVCRKNVALNIDGEKTTEDVLHNAVKNGAKLLEPYGATLLDYTSFSDTRTSPGHYLLFWEVEQGSTPIPWSVFEDCCLTIEESLETWYRCFRVAGSIGPLEIKVVEAGTFDKLMERAIRSGASINHYKTPRCVKSAHIVELLNSRIVGDYFSQKFPNWVPADSINIVDSEESVKN